MAATIDINLELTRKTAGSDFNVSGDIKSHGDLDALILLAIGASQMLQSWGVSKETFLTVMDYVEGIHKEGYIVDKLAAAEQIREEADT